LQHLIDVASKYITDHLIHQKLNVPYLVIVI